VDRVIRAQQARAARGVCERALDANGWKWNVQLSRWLDALLVIEERES
jgi:hypothetical protein